MTRGRALADNLVTLDSVDVAVLTDDVSDNYVSKTRFAVSEFANVVLSGASVISGEALLCANLGFGLRLVSNAGGQRHTMLFDTGPEAAIFIRNCTALGVGFREIEAIAITHGHWDHIAALTAAIDRIIQQGGQRHTMLFDTGPEAPIFIRNCTALGVGFREIEAIAITHGHWDHIAALTAAIDRIIQQGGQRHTMLFDTGPEAPIFIRNCTALGVGFREIEAIAITHGHWDHMAALPATIDRIIQQGGRVAVHVNPGMFNERAVRLSSGKIVPVANVPLPPELGRRGAMVVNDAEGRLLLDGHFYYSGEIPRVTAFEKGRDDHFCRKNPEARWEPDPLLLDERLLVAKA